MKRYRARVKEKQQEAKDAMGSRIVFRKLADIEAGAAGACREVVAVGNAFSTKELVQHACREVAECLGLQLIFNVNTDVRVDAVVCTADFDEADFLVKAHFNTKDNKWTIQHSSISGRKNGEIVRNARRTAYTDANLGAMIKQILGSGTGQATAKSIRECLAGYVQFSDLLTDHQIQRARRLAMDELNGRASDNIQLLPKLKDEMEKRGHSMGYHTFGGHEMLNVVLSVAKSEAQRLKKAAAQVPAARRSAQQRSDFEGWKPEAWKEKHVRMLDQLVGGDHMYAESAYISFKHVQSSYIKSLAMVQADAAHGKLQLDCYQVFIVVGFTANMNIMPLLYYYIAGNESEVTWTRVMEKLDELFPHLSGNVTFLTDQEKGLMKSVVTTFDNAPHMVCSYHRGKNLARHRRETVGVYQSMLRARTVADINALRADNAGTYRALEENARKAVDSVKDWHQFPACVVRDNTAAGGPAAGITYGRTASSAVEATNAHILPARSLDLVNSILWVCDHEVKRFEKQYAQAHGCEDVNTPHASQRLHKLYARSLQGTTVTDIKSTEEVETFLVQTTKDDGTHNSYEVELLVPSAGYNGDTLFGDCTCGIPLRDYFPCYHMMAVARKRMKAVDLLVPLEFRAETWKEQFPPDLVVTVPNMAHVVASEIPADEFLRLPVTAPPKRGRPNKKRKFQGIEAAMKRKAAAAADA